jgi:hypothetical protein
METETKTIEITQTKLLQIVGAVVAVIVIAVGSFALGRSSAPDQSFDRAGNMQRGGMQGWSGQGGPGGQQGQSGPGGMQGQLPPGGVPGGQGTNSAPDQRSGSNGSSSRSSEKQGSSGD